MEILFTILWAVWRRCLGGYGGFKRSHCVIVMYMLCLPYLLISTISFIILAVGCSFFWLPGHRFEEKTIVLRYPLIGIVYPISKTIMGNKKINDFIDGWTSLAELLLGGAFGLIYGIVLETFIGGL